MIVLYFFIAVLIGLVVFHVITRYSRSGQLLRKLPGDYPLPLVGNLLKFNKTCAGELWEEARNLTNKYYPITRVWFVESALVAVRHPDDVQIILSSQKTIDKGYIYDHIQDWLKTGLLTSTGEKWRIRRKILTPAFHFNILKKYLDVINDESERCVQQLKSEGDQTVKSLLPFTSELTLNIICETAMGVTLSKMEKNTIKDYKKAVQDFGAVMVYRLPRPYIFDWMFKLPWKWSKVLDNSLKILHGFTEKVVKERRAYHDSTEYKYLKGFEDDENTTSGRKRRLAMLDLLLAAEQENLIDNEGILEEVDTFTFEGHDTTGMALTFTLMLLAEDRQAQERVRAEATEILNRNNRKLDMTSIQELDYLDRVIKESLRLYPPVSTIFRRINEDLQLKHALIPGGTDIMISFYDTHRDPNYWTDPDKFDPDRFLPENCKDRHPYAYVPFSAGPRNCIGQKFAIMELKSTIAQILYDYQLEPIDRRADLKLMADIVIRPLNPIRIKFTRINKD